MPVEITRHQAPVKQIAVKDTQGHRCVTIAPVNDGATVQHDEASCVETAFLDATALRMLAAALIDIALAVEGEENP